MVQVSLHSALGVPELFRMVTPFAQGSSGSPRQLVHLRRPEVEDQTMNKAPQKNSK